jgi:valyl-tRNA synthetase
MENYEFSKARDNLRSFFWDTFCGDYLEITKQRLDEENQSAEYTLRTAHKKFMKLFAPLLSHITEEIWNQMYSSNSVHTSNWPETSGENVDLEAGENGMQIISALRKYKSNNQMSLNEEIVKVQIFGNIEGMEDAIQEVMHIQELEELEEEPDTEKKIVEISLNYSKAGPKYGDKVGEIEEALEKNEWMLEDGRLEVAGEHLKAEEFEVKEEVTYKGEGEMYEADSCIVILRE